MGAVDRNRFFDEVLVAGFTQTQFRRSMFLVSIRDHLYGVLVRLGRPAIVIPDSSGGSESDDDD